MQITSPDKFAPDPDPQILLAHHREHIFLR